MGTSGLSCVQLRKQGGQAWRPQGLEAVSWPQRCCNPARVESFPPLSQPSAPPHCAPSLELTRGFQGQRASQPRVWGPQPPAARGSLAVNNGSGGGKGLGLQPRGGTGRAGRFGARRGLGSPTRLIVSWGQGVRIVPIGGHCGALQAERL